MGYCNASDVQSVNRSRILGQGNNPTASDVTTYINIIAGEIDAILTTRGVQVPVAVGSFPEAAMFLQGVNVKGAVWMTEQAAPTNPAEVEKTKAAYDAALKLLSDAKFTLNVPSDQARAQVRAPFITFHPTGQTYDPVLANVDSGGQAGDGISAANTSTNQPQNPFFSRQQKF